jgi:hypothetical protein
MTVIRKGLDKIRVNFKNLPPEIVEGEFIENLEAQNQLRQLTDNKSQEDYIWNVKEYPRRIKKIYVKGASKKAVQRQVLDIKTNSIETDPVIFLDRIDTTFGEL